MKTMDVELLGQNFCKVKKCAELIALQHPCLQDRSLQSREELGPLNAHLFNLTGKRWRSLRTRLTPSFTSGKMKMMFDLMTVCAHQLKEYLEKASQKGETLEMKEVMAKFTTDVIGLCAFGLQSNAISDSDSEFRQMGRQIFQSSPLAAMRVILELTFPSLLKIFRIKAFPDKVSKFFIGTVKDVIEFRETNNVSRNDFMQLLIELKNKGKVQDDEPAKSEDVLDGTPHKASENNIGKHTVFHI
jgi:cytochrome P450 family 6